MYRLLFDLLVAIAVVVIVMLLAATLVGHAAPAPEPWQMCKVRTAVGVSALVFGCMSAGACLGLVACSLMRGDR
jgi:hypothetical protein